MNHSENVETQETFERNYQAGQKAFENGQYRASIAYLETACALVKRSSCLGGEVQIWLVIAYQAANATEAAIALCEKLLFHPDSQTKKQAKNLSYILKAPQLKRPEEWMTNIPDLVNLDGNSLNNYYANIKPKAQENRDRIDELSESSSLDPQEINNQDNQFTEFALLLILLILGGFFVLSP